MAEAVGDRVHADVGEHPVGRHAVRDAQRVVEAVAAGALPERLADAERHEVADDRERGGRHLEQLGHADPQRRVARSPAGPGSSQTARARRRARLVEPVCDRALVAVHQRPRRAVVGRRARRAGSPTARRAGAAGRPSAPSTVRISVSPTCAITRAWQIWCPRTTSITSSSSDRRRAREREVLRGRPDARPAGDAAPSPRCTRRARSRRTARRFPT